ncbi:AgmX/PglI C-terminal domain-containing protein [Paraliomyxa miuraensis]|uniref:AgmX/PglI C-terminal domain-containing protein n=1 Tax=Paraliomyxa miuraensis TaxID=376150 RepID=UPI002251E065|nr:AgmX/PglI C-terminal domain-containing protein [Paraliomyxa miuraensis]MCX4246862.1 AgmX/PglI C-terminal domain-containing protein [Paraliomyxa miuraensis]
MSRTINLKIFKNEQLIGSRTFSQEVIKIGKLRSSDLYLEDDAVARMHAVLEVTAGELRLVDLGSAGGSSINDQRVTKSAAIQGGDSLRVGPFRIEVEAAAVTAKAPTPAVRSAITAVAAAPAVAIAPALAHAPVSPRATLPVDARDVEHGDRHVAEVVTSYGKTVLDVQHVGQVGSRRKQAPAFFALGGLLLLAGGGLLAHEVSQDWEGYQQAQADAAVSGRPAPEAPGLGLGGLAMALALLGLVPMGLGLSRREDVGLDRYTLGEGPDASFKVAMPGLGDQSFPLVLERGDAHVLRFTPQMSGYVSMGNQRLDLPELVRSGAAVPDGSSYAMSLPHGAKAHLEHGELSYEVSSVNRGKVIAKGNDTDKPFWIYNAASFAVIGGLLSLSQLVPEDALSMSMDDVTAENRYVGYMAQPDDEEDQPEEIVLDADEPDEQEAGDQPGKRHKDTEGKAGNPVARPVSGLMAMKGPKSAIPSMDRNYRPEVAARNMGILGMMELESGHFLSSPTGTYAIGNDDSDVWGNLTGTAIGDAYGVAGFGDIGTGRGGGGDGDGTVGLGEVGLMGRRGSGGDRLGYDQGKGTGFKDRTTRQPRVSVAKDTKVVGIDKDMIRRVIKNHHNEVRHCYNQGLARDPNLKGRVAVMFTIGPAGTVPSAAVSENTLSNRDVANCVAKSVRRWKFPKPKTGGSAMVTYPFLFSPG